MKFCVIGLGRLGNQIAITLAENGMDVMAIDSNELAVNSVCDKVAQAVCIQSIDEQSLRDVGVDQIPTVIVTMGSDFETSTLVTVLLKKKFNIPNVITRATNENHKEILKLIGADHYFLPEKEVGIRLADKLSSPFMDLIRLDEEFCVSQIMTPSRYIGEKINTINFFQKYNIHCIGIKKADNIISGDLNCIITEKDKLIFAGKNSDLETFVQQ